MVGFMYTIDTFEDVFTIHYAGDLIIPEIISTISVLNTTLDLLYSFKNHHVKLTKRIQSAVEKSELQKQLNMLHPETTDDADCGIRE